jgi:hypothetical protein
LFPQLFACLSFPSLFVYLGFCVGKMTSANCHVFVTARIKHFSVVNHLICACIGKSWTGHQEHGASWQILHRSQEGLGHWVGSLHVLPFTQPQVSCRGTASTGWVCRRVNPSKDRLSCRQTQMPWGGRLPALAAGGAGPEAGGQALSKHVIWWTLRQEGHQGLCVQDEPELIKVKISVIY